MNDQPQTLDENGQDAYWDDWLWGCKIENQDGIASNGQRVTTALALQIAADILRDHDPSVPAMPHRWDDRDLKLARAAIAGIRAQHGIMGSDAEFLGEPDGIAATHQIDIWVYG